MISKGKFKYLRILYNARPIHRDWSNCRKLYNAILERSSSHELVIEQFYPTLKVEPV